MSNKAFRLHAKGAPIEQLRSVIAPCVIAELENDIDRRNHGKSMIEVIGARWRKEHGFDRPFLRLGGRGSSGGYRERQAAAEAARNRKAQKAARVRSKMAQGVRSAGIMLGKAMMLARKAARGS